MFVFGDVVYAQTVLLAGIDPERLSSHFHMPVRPMLLHHMALFFSTVL